MTPTDPSDTALRHQIRERTVRAGVLLSHDELDQLVRYYSLLEKWNRTINLTALPLTGYPDKTVDRLIAEPWLAASQLPDCPGRWLDLGSGGGSPAIPMKIARPSLQLIMVEARERKAAFLREVVSSLALASSDVRTCRFETLADAGLRGMVNVVTVRAVRIDKTLLDASAALLKPGGRLIMFGSPTQESRGDPRFSLIDEVFLSAVDAELTVLGRAGEPRK